MIRAEQALRQILTMSISEESEEALMPRARALIEQFETDSLAYHQAMSSRRETKRSSWRATSKNCATSSIASWIAVLIWISRIKSCDLLEHLSTIYMRGHPDRPAASARAPSRRRKRSSSSPRSGRCRPTVGSCARRAAPSRRPAAPPIESGARQPPIGACADEHGERFGEHDGSDEAREAHEARQGALQAPLFVVSTSRVMMVCSEGVAIPQRAMTGTPIQNFGPVDARP